MWKKAQASGAFTREQNELLGANYDSTPKSAPNISGEKPPNPPTPSPFHQCKNHPIQWVLLWPVLFTDAGGACLQGRRRGPWRQARQTCCCCCWTNWWRMATSCTRWVRVWCGHASVSKMHCAAPVMPIRPLLGWLFVMCIPSSFRDGSSFMWHQPCQRCKYTTSVDIKKMRCKKLFTHVIRIRSESARERRIAYIKAINNNNNKCLHNTIL